MTIEKRRIFAASALTIAIVAALSVYLVTPSVPVQVTFSSTLTTTTASVEVSRFTFAEVSSTPTSTTYGYNYIELVTVTFPGPSICPYPAYCTFATLTYLAENPNPQWSTSTLYSQSTFTTTSSSSATTVLPETYRTMALETSATPPYAVGENTSLELPLLLVVVAIVALWLLVARGKRHRSSGA